MKTAVTKDNVVVRVGDGQGKYPPAEAEMLADVLRGRNVTVETDAAGKPRSLVIRPSFLPDEPADAQWAQRAAERELPQLQPAHAEHGRPSSGHHPV